MTVNLEEIGLSSIVDQFDLFFIDIWGVVHNGIKLNLDAINVLEKLNDKNKDYVLLTNAPRPNSTVINFLKQMGCIFIRLSANVLLVLDYAIQN